MWEQTAETLTITLLCALLGVAVWSDVREHRISNWLVLSVLGTGLVIQVLSNGAMGIVYALGGVAVGLAFFLPFYIGRGMGAGDVKLMGAAGGVLGPMGALLAGALTLIAGVVMVVAALGVRRLDSRFQFLRMAPALFVEKNDATRVPYAPAIATGCGIAMWQLGHLSKLSSVVN